MKNEKDETITSRKGIANVFDEFYCKHYAEERCKEEVQDPHESEIRTNTEGENRNDDDKNEVPEFTQDETQTAIDSLKNVAQVTTMESVDKTSRHATTRRRRW